MIYTRIGIELTIEQGFQSTIKYFQSTVKYARQKVLYLLDISCNDDCTWWCSVDCRSASQSVPSQFSPPEMDEPAGLPVDTDVPSHRKACWDVEEEETQCLNGGSCFAVELHNGMRRAGCSCPPRWTGERCEMRYIDPSLWADTYDGSYYRTASVNVEIGLLIMACFILLSVGSVILRRHRRRSPFRIWTGHHIWPTSDDGSVIACGKNVNPSDCHVVQMDDNHFQSARTLHVLRKEQASKLCLFELITDEKIILKIPTSFPFPVSHPQPQQPETIVQDLLLPPPPRYPLIDVNYVAPISLTSPDDVMMT